MWQIVLVFTETVLLSLLLHLVPNRIKEGDRNDHGIVATISMSVLS